MTYVQGEPLGISPDPVVIRDKDGRLMLAIRSDGSWEVGPEDAPEAARLFAEAVAELLHFALPATDEGIPGSGQVGC